MERFIKGDIVVVPFPFSDLSATKRRPALVLAPTVHNDLILCQITSQFNYDDISVEHNDEEIKGGKLGRKSFIRPNKLFTADSGLILYKIGNLKRSTQIQVIDQIIRILSE
jgi:mRNA interferase MazF